MDRWTRKARNFYRNSTETAARTDEAAATMAPADLLIKCNTVWLRTARTPDGRFGLEKPSPRTVVKVIEDTRDLAARRTARMVKRAALHRSRGLAWDTVRTILDAECFHVPNCSLTAAAAAVGIDLA